MQLSHDTRRTRYFPVFSSQGSSLSEASSSLLSPTGDVFSGVIFHLHVNSFMPGNPRDILNLLTISVPLST